MKTLSSLLALLFLLTTYTTYSQVQTVDQVLIKKGELEDYELIGEPRLIDSEGLKEHNPVFAPVVLEYGYNIALLADYKNKEGNTLSTEVYEMKDIYASYGLFTILDLYDAEPDDIGEEGQIVQNEAIFIQGKYIVRLYCDVPEDQNEQLLKKAADLLASKIESTGAKNLPVIQNLIQVLPVERVSLPEVQYFRGYRGLNMVYAFNEEDIWGFEGGVAGIYPAFTIIVLRFSNETKAKNQWNFNKRLFSIDPNFQSFHSAKSEAFQMYDKKGIKISGNLYRQFFIIFLYRGNMNVTPMMSEIKHSLDLVFQ